METLMSAVESTSAVAAGLAIRTLLLLVVLAVLSVPAMFLATVIWGADAVRRRLLGDRSFYAPGHTWIRRTWRGRVAVGLDELAQCLFSWDAGLKLPQPGTVVLAHEPMGEIRTMGRRAALVSPVNGIVASINPAVLQDPSLVHRDPYARGWLMTVVPSDSDYERLPRGESAKTWLRNEGNRLSRFFETQLGVAAADGGEFVAPPPTMLSDQQWTALTREFLANTW